ncbi:hypothetical protein E2C01_039836 [Portunus trituberculatus]|uniref:Uncharacterized protein n=1 Tax=Portunus trituberculatus TaxID=210409 RepID=A0A5B7FL88_PORTR|nr:hypothetical protein [Portunus trituberculatus]
MSFKINTLPSYLSVATSPHTRRHPHGFLLAGTEMGDNRESRDWLSNQEAPPIPPWLFHVAVMAERGNWQVARLFSLESGEGDGEATPYGAVRRWQGSESQRAGNRSKLLQGRSSVVCYSSPQPAR